MLFQRLDKLFCNQTHTQTTHQCAPMRVRFSGLLAVFFTLMLCVAPVRAGDDGMSFIRDAEIEHYLHTLADPVFRAAGLDPPAVTIAIIQSPVLNAFVAGGMNIFIYTGLLQQTKDPGELLGVIAHETGHIAGGHLARGSEAMSNASAEAIIGTVAGIAAGIAAGRGDVAIGAIGGAQEIAERNLLSFSRAQESSADTAALSFLDKTGQSASGMLAFMKLLAGQELLPSDKQAQYMRTHPFSQERVDEIAHHLEKSPYANVPMDPALVTMHERMKAKLTGFLQPEMALLRYTDKDPRVPARYARAIALYRTSRLDRALPIMDSLLKDEPQNPFFIELKAQMLFENGRIAEAVDLYQKCVTLIPDSALLRVSYAHAILELSNPQKLDTAVENLLEANRLETRDPQTWHYLAAAWSSLFEATKQDKYQGLVAYALAEESVAKGHDKVARQFAEKALLKLDKGSPYWLRAQDIKFSADDHPKD